MSKKRERKDDDDLALDPEEQQNLNVELLDACERVSLADVRAALKKCAFITAATTGTVRTGLALACACVTDEAWPAAEAVVKLLLSRGAAIRSVDVHGMNALHTACFRSSRAVVKLLLDADPALVTESVLVANSLYVHETPLMFCCHGSDNEAIAVATLLLERGALVNQKSPNRSSLMLAAKFGTADLVSLLLANGADVQATAFGGKTALTKACSNGAFGRAIIPLLRDALPRSTNSSATQNMLLGRASRFGFAMADALIPLCTASNVKAYIAGLIQLALFG